MQNVPQCTALLHCIVPVIYRINLSVHIPVPVSASLTYDVWELCVLEVQETTHHRRRHML